MNPIDDPGWRGALIGGLSSILWPFGSKRRTERFRSDPLLAMRIVFLSFCWALVAFGVVLFFLGGSRNTADGSGPAIVLASLTVLGVASVVLVRFFPARLDCSSDSALGGSWRSRMFIRLAFSEAVAMAGFVAFFFWGLWWTYPLGAAFAAVGFFLLAPSARNLARDQDELTSSGCTRDLVRALRDPQDG